jgi:hypothetical protein
MEVISSDRTQRGIRRKLFKRNAVEFKMYVTIPSKISAV